MYKRRKNKHILKKELQRERERVLTCKNDTCLNRHMIKLWLQWRCKNQKEETERERDRERERERERRRQRVWEPRKNILKKTFQFGFDADRESLKTFKKWTKQILGQYSFNPIFYSYKRMKSWGLQFESRWKGTLLVLSGFKLKTHFPIDRVPNIKP